MGRKPPARIRQRAPGRRHEEPRPAPKITIRSLTVEDRRVTEGPPRQATSVNRCIAWPHEWASGAPGEPHLTLLPRRSHHQPRCQAPAELPCTSTGAPMRRSVARLRRKQAEPWVSPAGQPWPEEMKRRANGRGLVRHLHSGPDVEHYGHRPKHGVVRGGQYRRGDGCPSKTTPAKVQARRAGHRGPRWNAPGPEPSRQRCRPPAPRCSRRAPGQPRNLQLL
jgi:hypothetical protein